MIMNIGGIQLCEYSLNNNTYFLYFSGQKVLQTGAAAGPPTTTQYLTKPAGRYSKHNYN